MWQYKTTKSIDLEKNGCDKEKNEGRYMRCHDKLYISS